VILIIVVNGELTHTECRHAQLNLNDHLELIKEALKNSTYKKEEIDHVISIDGLGAKCFVSKALWECLI
jgi:hypothetical protein